MDEVTCCPKCKSPWMYLYSRNTKRCYGCKYEELISKPNIKTKPAISHTR